MKYLKLFDNYNDNVSGVIKKNGTISTGGVDGDNLFYETGWEKFLPDEMSIDYHNKNFTFKKGNIMLLGDMVEASYDLKGGDQWGQPDTLEFDFYFVNNNNDGKIRVNIDITYGDLMAAEFSLEAPNKVNVIEHTTYHSKFDPDNTVFALTDKSLKDFVGFLNRLPNMKLNTSDFKFLDKLDNYKE